MTEGKIGNAADGERKAPSVFKEIRDTLTKMGGAVVIFYALGFTVLQCFVASTGVDGMFWFSKQYYEEAGGKFILELIRAPLMNPVFFVPYLLALLWFIPKKENMEELVTFKATLKVTLSKFSNIQRIKALVLLLIVLLTYLFAVFFDHDIVVQYIMPVFSWFSYIQPGHSRSIVFFTVTVPVAVATFVFLLRFHEHRQANKRLYNLLLSLYIVFVAIIPISYGLHLYDMKAVPINDPAHILTSAGMETDGTASPRMWLLGKFEGKYLFLRIDDFIADADTPMANIPLGRIQGVIEALDVENIKHMNFTLERADSLKHLMEDSRASPAFEEEASAVFDSIFN